MKRTCLAILAVTFAFLPALAAQKTAARLTGTGPGWARVAEREN